MLTLASMVRFHFIATLTLSGMLFALSSPAYQDFTQTTERRLGTPPVVSAAEPPAGTEKLPVQWMKVSAPGQGVMLVAVARPRGAGPFPTVILLHGTHGFAQQYVRLAQDLARGGLLAVAACWFSGGSEAGARFITPIGCPDAPPLVRADSPEAMQRVGALVQATHALPGARPDRIALFGHSRGGGAALNYILTADNVRVAVLNSAGYSSELAGRAGQVKTPILILHGMADSAADGGSPFTSVHMAHDFEAALRRAGKPVEVMYYKEGRHNSIFTSSAQYNDELRRMLEFLRRYLRN